MPIYRTVLTALLALALLTPSPECRPTDDDEGDFRIDNIPGGPEGSGVAEKELSPGSTKGIPLLAPGEEILVDGSGSGVSSDDLSGQGIVSGSASGDQDRDIEGPDGHPAKFTSLQEVNISSTTVHTPTSTSRVIFRADEDHGSGHEEDPDWDLSTEPPGDLVSGSGIGFSTGEPSTPPPTTVPPSTEIPTLPPDIGIGEDLIPISVAKTTDQSFLNSTVVVTSVPTSTPESLPGELTLPTPNATLMVHSESGEITPSGTSTSSHEQPDPYGPTQTTNHTRHKEGRRRRPIHTATTEGAAHDGVSIGATKEEEDNSKQVSYFAVIAAALISAVVFFALGYVVSKLKDNRGTFTLPWKKERVNLEANIGTGNGSAVQVYRDTNPDRQTSVYDELNPDGVKPKVNGSSEKVPTNDLAEIHPKPGHLTETEPDHETPIVPNKSGTSAAPPARGSLDEMKYMDETDDDMEAPVAATPLLPEDPKEGAERADLATQVLNTVEKNRNAVSENTGLLTEDSSDDLSPV